jgi:DinB superfamily
MATTEELLESLERAGEEYAQFIEGQSPEAFHRRPGPDEWTAAELTGHVSEFPATFADQARRLASSPGAPLGRTLDDPGRLAALARLAGAGPPEAARPSAGAFARRSSPSAASRRMPGRSRAGISATAT